ncbi:tail completion protein gp17 [Chromobacterium haemolyticum]|uniref:tail completion protein gp17 n=1 Tax=Chromobacterium haemolyticum TaxID=394935 RepID=UPI0009D946BD|nr:DUF3168 domain-containing protein [Chromobacterium haemolyticum]OQS41822.1 hypothetical protein B0T39_07750 [Chromobacterium haemolyticum]
MLGEIIVSLLAAGPAAGALAGRVYPGELPPEPALPAVAYQRIAQRERLGAGGVAGLEACQVQLSIVAEDYDTACSVAAAIRRGLSGWRGGLAGSGGTGYEVRRVVFESEHDVAEGMPAVVAQTWAFHWRERPPLAG